MAYWFGFAAVAGAFGGLIGRPISVYLVAEVLIEYSIRYSKCSTWCVLIDMDISHIVYSRHSAIGNIHLYRLIGILEPSPGHSWTMLGRVEIEALTLSTPIELYVHNIDTQC